MIPMKGEEEPKLWDPHASYHIDGTHHQKSYDHKFSSRRGPRPDSAFRGVVCLLARPIAAREPRAFGVHCKTEQFAEVFEIPVHELRSETYRLRYRCALDLKRDFEIPGLKFLVSQ